MAAGWSIASRRSPISPSRFLQVNRAAGERAYIRLQGNGKLFVSKSIIDTITLSEGPPREGQPRYRWELQPDGAEFGYLVPE